VSGSSGCRGSRNICATDEAPRTPSPWPIPSFTHPRPETHGTRAPDLGECRFFNSLLVGLPEDAPFEVTAAEIAADTSKIAAFSELLGCAVKDTSNCSAHNVSLDVLTLLAPSILSLAPADFRRGAEVGEGLNDIINLVRSYPLFTPAGAAEPASACNFGPQP
jgi:hypothetical protein